MIGPEVRERVRWQDVDTMGIAYYGAYLRYMEAAETEFLRAVGLSHLTLADEHGVWLARVRLEMDYRHPARLDDEVIVRAELTRIGNASLRFVFPLDRADGVRLVDGVLVLAALGRETLRAVRVPDALRARLSV